jgi:hypothetical protein
VGHSLPALAAGCHWCFRGGRHGLGRASPLIFCHFGTLFGATAAWVVPTSGGRLFTTGNCSPSHDRYRLRLDDEGRTRFPRPTFELRIQRRLICSTLRLAKKIWFYSDGWCRRRSRRNRFGRRRSGGALQGKRQNRPDGTRGSRGVTPHCLRARLLLLPRRNPLSLPSWTWLGQHAFQIPQERAADGDDPAVEKIRLVPAEQATAPEEKTRRGIATPGPEGTTEERRAGEWQPQRLQSAAGFPFPEGVGRRGEAPRGAGAVRRPHGWLLV